MDQVLDAKPLPLARIQVTDTGIGIQKENFPLLFKRFGQLDASTKRAFGGKSSQIFYQLTITKVLRARLGFSSMQALG